MIDQYLFHPASQKLLDVFINNPKGCLLLDSASDYDLEMATKYINDQIFKTNQDKHGYVYQLADNTIDSLRTLMANLHLTRLDAQKTRLLIIPNCHLMSLIMQNALLKNLEEPPVGSCFILTSSQSGQILSTISSRCQIIKLKKPLKEDLFKLYSQYDQKQLEQAYWASDGFLNLMHDYLTNQDSLIHQEINLAKQFLSFSLPQRLKFILGEKNLTNKDLEKNLNPLINGLWRISRASLLSSANLNEAQKMKLWRQKFITINKLKINLEDSLNPKLIALNLSLRF